MTYAKIWRGLIPLLFLTGAPLASAAAAFQEGVAYEKIVPAQPTTSGDKIEVVELFWYGCPHCFRFQPYIEQWAKAKPENVVYVRMPAILRDSWEIHARAYYAAEALGVVERIHKPLFDAFHNQKRSLDTADSLAAFFAEHGVSTDDFRKAFTSFAVDSKVRRARQMTMRYKTTGTPSVVVNGKYRTDPGMARGFDTLIQIIDYLVAKESGAAR